MVRGFLALGGSPRRHGWTQLEKRVSLDPGRGPGADFERICAHQRSLLPKVILTCRRLRGAATFAGWPEEGRREGRPRFLGGREDDDVHRRSGAVTGAQQRRARAAVPCQRPAQLGYGYTGGFCSCQGGSLCLGPEAPATCVAPHPGRRRSSTASSLAEENQAPRQAPRALGSGGCAGRRLLVRARFSK